MSYRDTYNYSPSPEQARKYLLDAIKAGESILRDGIVNEQIFDSWFDYSRRVIQTALGQNSLRIEANYLDLQISMLRNRISPLQKLDYSIRFLLDIAKAI